MPLAKHWAEMKLPGSHCWSAAPAIDFKIGSLQHRLKNWDAATLDISLTVTLPSKKDFWLQKYVVTVGAATQKRRRMTAAVAHHRPAFEEKQCSAKKRCWNGGSNREMENG
ncbi:hypothetical protein LR48_Vigan758s000100 [Vigna angularis]|uniref:Uncharacterized protein n=1 Tax=Phaseolus angularis TaxID=3914 RepID=A0A0L9THV5_PHAAN|nr:hypothetical protein LR48_Vigan758s000100 [Vigna angularis]